VSESRVVLLVLTQLAVVPASCAQVGNFPSFDFSWSDEFGRDVIRPQWYWINELPGQWSVYGAAGFLRLYSTAGWPA